MDFLCVCMFVFLSGYLSAQFVMLQTIVLQYRLSTVNACKCSCLSICLAIYFLRCKLLCYSKDSVLVYTYNNIKMLLKLMAHFKAVMYKYKKNRMGHFSGYAPWIQFSMSYRFETMLKKLYKHVYYSSAKMVPCIKKCQGCRMFANSYFKFLSDHLLK